MPIYRIDRHSVHLHAHVVILKFPSGEWLMTNYAEGVTAISNRVINQSINQFIRYLHLQLYTFS